MRIYPIGQDNAPNAADSGGNSGARLCFEVQGEKPAAPSDPVRFRGVAYSGGLIPGYGWYGESAIDLASLAIPDSYVFALTDHDPTKRAGRAKLSRDGDRLAVEGFLFQNTDAGREVAALFQESAPWQFSVGLYDADIETSDRVHPVDLNGRTLEVKTVFRNATVREVSFVPIGADPNTHAETFGHKPGDHETMTIEELQAQITALQAELTAANATIETMRAENAAREAAAAEAAMTARRAAVVELFAAIGVEHTDEAAAPYLAMDAAAFAAVSAQMRAMHKEPGSHLFRRQATGGGSGDAGKAPVINMTAIYADRAKAMNAA